MAPVPLRVVQVTDFHLFANEGGALLACRTNSVVEGVVRAAGQTRPDLLLLTGDVAQDGSSESYARAAAWIADLGVPCLLVAGNHDIPAEVARLRARAPFLSETVVDRGGWRFVALDSAQEGATAGRVGASQLAALEEALSAAPERPTCVVLHHHPVPIGTPWLEPIGLEDGAAFREVVGRHRQARLVLFGHVHQERTIRLEESLYLACPSAAFQFRPGSPSFAVDPVPPGYRSLALYADGRIATSVHRVGEAPAADLTATGY